MNIAILGAGVAGVSLGIVLKQRGHDVTLYERHAVPTTIGGGMVLWPNAVFVLDQLGLSATLARLGGRPTRMQRLSADGQDLGALDITALDARMGHPSLSILRRDLMSVLLDELAAQEVPVRYGHEVSAISSMPGMAASVTFANGHRIAAELVVGADGRMNSVARHFVNGSNTPVYQGFVNWVGVCESRTDLVEDMAVVDVWGVGERFGLVPVTRRKLYWAGAVAQPAIDLSGQSTSRRELLALFGHWPAPIAALIEGTPEGSIRKIHVHDHDPLGTWHRDKVVLVGDSAHACLPTSGQGACQALEDAWQLANCLDEGRGSLPEALQAFTARRVDKTTTITMAGRGFASSLFNPDANFCRLRNERARQADDAPAVASIAQLWGRDLPLHPAP